MLLWFCCVTSLSVERVVAAERSAVTWGFSFAQTTITLWRAASTCAADWRRSKLFAVASATTASKRSSAKDFNQPSSSFAGFGVELHAGGSSVALGNA